MDVYFGYNEILMYELDREKTTFTSERANYKYNVMPFSLNNADITYKGWWKNL